MSRIHPSSENKKGSNRLHRRNHDAANLLPIAVSSSPNHETLTVWKRSSMSFHGTDGFTVYDHHGRLAFRVDNYSRNGWSCSTSLAGGSNVGCGGSGGGGSGALVLMDGSGRPLLTLRPQIFSIHSQWNGCIYSEDDNKSSKKNRRIFMMRRPSNVIALRPKQNKKTKCEAEVFFNHLAEPEESDGFWKQSRQPDYKIEGTFWNRDCKIRTRSGEVAAKITRKKTGTAAMMNGSSSSSSTIMLSEEVFTLVVKPGFDSQFIMAFVVILDRICFKPFFNPLMCS